MTISNEREEASLGEDAPPEPTEADAASLPGYTPLSSEEQYRSIFEATSDAMAIVDLEGRIVEANQATCRLHGYPYEELIGKSVEELTHPHQRDTVDPGIDDITHGGSAERRIVGLRKDGTIFHAETHGTMFTYRGQPHILAVARDITEKVATERQLRETEQQYRAIFEAVSDGLIICDPSAGTVVEANSAVCAMHGYTREEFIGLHGTAFIHPDDHPTFGRFIETISAGGHFQTQAIDTRKDGSKLDVEVHGSPVIYRGMPAILAVVRDISERVRAYELLEQRVEERTRELSTLLEISRNVASTLELQPLLGLILDELRSVVEYDSAGILEQTGDELRGIGYRGPLNHELALGLRGTVTSDLPVWPALRNREIVIIDDVQGDTPEAENYRRTVGEQFDGRYGFIRSFMAVPMIVGERVVGVLTLSHHVPGYYSAHRADLALAIAQQAAVAIENAQLYERAQDVAVLEERQRLSRELHDSVSQALYSIALAARTARTLLDRDPVKAVEPMEFVLAQAETGLAEMRALIFQLRPETLEQEGLTAALERQVAAHRARHRIEIEAELCREPEIGLPAKEALYRIAQEALHNTVKHAQASHVQLSLQCEDRVLLEVKDDGNGFDASAAYPGHFGLRSMAERAARVGGSLHVESTPGQGTLVRVYVPTRFTPPGGNGRARTPGQ